MAGVEIVVDADVVLIAIGVVAITIRAVLAVNAPQPTNSRCIQSVADRVVVGRGHAAHQLPDPARRVDPGAVRVPRCEHTVNVPPEYIDGREISGCSRGLDRISIAIHGRRIRQDVTVLNAGEVTENALSRFVRQYGPREIALRDESLAVKQEKEKCLVLDDGATDAPAELIAVVVILSYSLEIVVPGIGAELRVAIRPEQTSMKLIGAGTRGHLNLPGAAPGLGVCGSDDHADFIHQVRAHVRGCGCT